ncbi:MAG: hypothetical protein J6V44_03175 [Methanobrevibacter sp.]|nr:hypothetical protein [Methanobrevibacter sp.]
MANIITGDKTKSIKNVGELALRINKFDSYRLFTLYENVKEGKVMNISGNQKFYLVFTSPTREIRIPEYDPKGFFEVDKVNGCVLFKITKKNAEDILSMKTGGERIFHIVRVYEETDAYGRVINVTDEVEVYNGKWGDDSDFNAFSIDNKIDLLTKALAAQIDKNAKLMSDYNDLLEAHNAEIKKTSDLEKDIEALRSERDSLQEQLNEYLGDTHDGTLLSKDTKYIAFESTMDNVSFTEEQYSAALNELMTTGTVDLTNVDFDSPRIDLNIKVYDDIKDLKITVYKNDISIGSAVYNQDLKKTIDADSGDVFKFECTGMPALSYNKKMNLNYSAVNDNFNKAVQIFKPLQVSRQLSQNEILNGTINGGTINGGTINGSLNINGNISGELDIIGGLDSPNITLNTTYTITAKINYEGLVDVTGNIGTLQCYI